jgi:integrase/recombinase XerD
VQIVVAQFGDGTQAVAQGVLDRGAERSAGRVVDERVVTAHVERLGQADDGVGRGGDVAVLIAADLARVGTDLGGQVPLGPSLFLAALDITEPASVSFAALESYQRHLFHHKKANGAPLSFRTQAQRIIPAKSFFAWMLTQGRIPFDPAVGLVLPKAEHRLPEATLSAEEAEAVLQGPDVTTVLGVRDRAILEVLYSTAIRRAELIGLRLWDIDHARGTVFVRQGKGARDRHVPIGARALLWVSRYFDLVRPKLVAKETDVLFLSASGEALCADWLSRTAKAYIAAGAPGKRGSCHLLRHTAATLMLEGGADIRYVSEMLGHAKLETTALYTNSQELHQTRGIALVA